MTRMTMAVLLALALAGCREDEPATTDTAQAVQSGGAGDQVDAAPEPGADVCGAGEMQDLVGLPFDADMLPPGDRTVRVLHPDTVVTMDFRADRLNIKLDADGKVQEVTCG